MKLDEVDVGTVATVIGRTERQVQRLVKDGVIQRTARGRYHLPTAVQSWGAWLVSGRSSSDISAERRKLLAAQARIKTVEARVAEASVISWNDAQAIVNEIGATCVMLMEGLPGRLAGQLSGMTDTAEIRKLLLDELRQIRTAAADRFDKLVAMAHGGPDPRRTPTRRPAGASKPATKARPRR
jgi:phage terminase Nu1 subunit (DNA packaging protein)